MAVKKVIGDWLSSIWDRIGAPVGASISADIAAIDVEAAIVNQNVSKEGWTAYYVDGVGGDDGDDGLTWGTAFKTIQHAIDTADSWAKIYINASTYAENLLVVKHGVQLIGEKRSTVIVQPAAGVAITLNGERCSVRTLTAHSPGINYAIDINGDHAEIVDVAFTGVTGAFGLHTWADYTHAHDCYISNANLIIGFGIAGDYCDIHDNYINLTYGSSEVCIFLHTSYNKVYENDLLNAYDDAVYADTGADNNSIYHNNFIGTGPKQIYDDGAGNSWFENYFDDYTTDTNNDGLCDSVYVGDTAAATDYQPVSRRNGWNQLSLGIGIGAGALQSGEPVFGGFEDVITLKAAADPAAPAAATKFTPNIPNGATITKAKLLMKFRDITCAAAANWVSTLGYVQVKKAGGAWLTGITVQVNMLKVASGAVGPGDVWIGNVDVKAQVADGIENEFKLITLRSNADDLLLRDVEFGLQIFFIP